MLIEIPYNRARAVEYARRWARSRNPLFYDFTENGGNCTNFVSQCIFAGCGIMNYTPTFGWYYISSTERAPAWTGVEALYDFLIGAPDFSENNGGVGPYGTNAVISRKMDIGDVIQLADEGGDFYHTLIISEITNDDILVCAQSNDALDRPLSSYNFSTLSIIHIEGARLLFDNDLYFQNILDGTALP